METFEDKLKKMTAWDTEPALTETEVGELLDSASIADANGASPQNDDWLPGYDLNAAAANGWLIKAGRSANTTATDPDSLNVASKIFDNCMQMAKLYSNKRRGAVRILPIG